MDYPGGANVITKRRQRIRVQAGAVNMEAKVAVVLLQNRAGGRDDILLLNGPTFVFWGSPPP